MKKLLIAGAALAALIGTPALAADMALKAPPPAVPTCDWCGWYVGIDGGGAWSRSRDVFVNETFAGAPFFNGTFGSINPTGGFGGGEFGYNWQNGAWLLGFETDLQGASIRDSQAATISPYLGGVSSISIATSERLDWFGTVRARLGWVAGPVLLYATGGLAYGDVRYSVNMADSFGFSASAVADSLRAGYAAGGGLEYKFAPKWSAKVEYQYINLGRTTVSAPEFVGGVVTAFAVSNTMKFDYQTLRVGINYHL